MQSLDEKTWKQLSAFGDGAPLHIETTNSSIDGIRLIDDGEKSVPYITRSDSNNGLARFVSAKNYEFGSDDGGCITVGLDTQTAFYQPHKFVTGQNVQVITGENISEDVAQFLVPILRQQMTAKFNWGGNGATLGRMKHLSVMLPVTDSGKPDYEYMAEYAQQKRNAMLAKYRAYVEERIAELGDPVEIPSLDEKEWREFPMNDVFVIGHGFYNKKPPMYEDGKIPFIGATDSHNGVTGFTNLEDIERCSKTGAPPNEPMERKIFHGGSIGVTNNGSVGYAYYQPSVFTCTHDVNPLYLRDRELSEPLAHFLCVCIHKQAVCFEYARKWRPKRMVHSKFMLPVNDSGQPDYEYMEQYAKNMMLRKYRQYLSFIRKAFKEQL